MLARNAHDLYWLGRHVVRAEHTARMLDGLFQLELEGEFDDPSSVSISWGSVVVIMGAGAVPGAGGPAARDEVIRRLTGDPSNPVSILSCVASAREGARRLRDTISAEMWQSLNTFHLELKGRDLQRGLRSGPYSLYSFVKERAALFRGLTIGTMQRDDAFSFLQAGDRFEAAAMMLRMLRVALPPVRPADDDAQELPRRDGNALALLRAVGGFQAFMRGAASPPKADPVARFLLFETDFPDSVASSLAALDRALTRADRDAGRSTPALRLRRLIADLELRRSSDTGHEDLPALFRMVQHELEAVEHDVDQRYFSGEDRSHGFAVVR